METVRAHRACQCLRFGASYFHQRAGAVYMLTGRSANMIPSRVEPSTRLVSSNFPYDTVTMRKELEERNGKLVYFNKISWRWYLPSENELKEKLKLQLLSGEENGAIYRMEEN